MSKHHPGTSNHVSATNWHSHRSSVRKVRWKMSIYDFFPAAQFVTPTFDLKLLCASVTNVTLAHTAAGVLFVGLQEFPTRTTAPNVHGSKKIVMVAPRSSTLVPVERTSSMRGVV
ncbi:unnamed protein product [Rhizoctonia solani]|uniref:Uncharacterized protein n=1 Tax=Rhizoctonia solani TaxID=456999 RepID=A0A8H2X403_9AGAM|nr:unnamed protein product [Rhizoctonia solani]